MLPAQGPCVERIQRVPADPRAEGPPNVLDVNVRLRELCGGEEPRAAVRGREHEVGEQGENEDAIWDSGGLQPERADFGRFGLEARRGQ